MEIKLWNNAVKSHNIESLEGPSQSLTPQQFYLA